MTAETVDVAIIGAGPAGSTLASALARRGIGVVVLERAPSWHWRAGGVFTSPAAVAALERSGLARDVIDAAAQPIPALRLETPGGAVVRLTYGAETGGPPAVGFDRSRLDPALEAEARAAGATIRRGAAVTSVVLGAQPRDRATLRVGDRDVQARIVVGADGLHSIVANAAGVARPARLPPRVGLTWHVRDDSPEPGREGRMIVFDDGYVGRRRSRVIAATSGSCSGRAGGRASRVTARSQRPARSWARSCRPRTTRSTGCTPSHATGSPARRRSAGA